MEQRIIVRLLQMDDIPSVAHLLSEAFYPSQGWLGWASPFLKLGIYQDLKNRALMQSAHSACLVGLHPSVTSLRDELIIGTVEVAAKSLYTWSLGGKVVPYVSNLAVTQPWRGRGVGQQLLFACEQVVQTWGFDELYLHVKDENWAARKLYAKVGYQLYRNEVPLWARFLGPSQELLLYKQLSLVPSTSRPKV